MKEFPNFADVIRARKRNLNAEEAQKEQEAETRIRIQQNLFVLNPNWWFRLLAQLRITKYQFFSVAKGSRQLM